MGPVSCAIMPLCNVVIGQASVAALTAPDGLLMQALPIAAMFAVIYFLLIRPSRAQRDQQVQLLASLKKDDEVVTSGGLFGRISSFDDELKVVTLEVADKVRIRVQRAAIVGLAERKK